MKEPNCWICKDIGLVTYEKIYNKIPYEMAYRCSCKKGLVTSERVPIVKEKLAEKLAMENYQNFIGKNSLQKKITMIN